MEQKIIPNLWFKGSAKDWENLSRVPEAEQCGWCKDQFGLSWQIVPENMRELLAKTGAFARLMPMKKLIIADF